MGSTDSKMADELARQASYVLQELLGPGHPTVTTMLHDLALACDGKGRKDHARSLWAQARRLLDAPGTDVTDSAAATPEPATSRRASGE